MVVVRTQQGWYDRTGSIQYPDIKSVLPRKYVKAINNITAPTELLSAKGVINRNSIHTGPERDRLIPIKLQLGPGVEIIGGCDTPHTPSSAPLDSNELFDLVRSLVLGLLFSPGSHKSIFNN